VNPLVPLKSLVLAASGTSATAPTGLPVSFIISSSAIVPSYPPTVTGIARSSAPTLPSSLNLFQLERGYDPTSLIRSRTPISIEINTLDTGFFESFKHTLDHSSKAAYQTHINDYTKLCNSQKLSVFPINYEKLARYCYYFIRFKPHPKDKFDKLDKHFHSVNSLKSVCAALTGYGRSNNQLILNDDEATALKTYCRRTLPRIFPPDPTPRFPVRLVMLEQARIARELQAQLDPSLSWVTQRNTLYPLLAHQGLFRTSELISMRSSDISFSRLSALVPPSSVTLTIRDPKTSNPFTDAGKQFVRLRARPDTPSYCPVKCLLDWLRVLNLINNVFVITHDATLWPIDASHLHTCISRVKVLENLRADMLAIGCPHNLAHLITGHGLRTGGSIDYRDSGSDGHTLQVHGRWKSSAWMAYSAFSNETPALPLSVSPLLLPAISSGLKTKAHDKTQDLLTGLYHHANSPSTQLSPIPALSSFALTTSLSASYSVVIPKQSSKSASKRKAVLPPSPHLIVAPPSTTSMIDVQPLTRSLLSVSPISSADESHSPLILSTLPTLPLSGRPLRKAPKRYHGVDQHESNYQ